MEKPLRLLALALLSALALAGVAAAARPSITVTAPRPHVVVHSGFLVSGTANVFEANVSIVLYGGRGQILAKRYTTATCGTGCWGRYRLRVRFHVLHRQPGLLVVHDDDAAGLGHWPHSVRVSLVLAP